MTAPVSKRISVLRAARRALSSVNVPNVFEKNGNVVIGIPLRIAPRARAKEDNTLNTVAIEFGYGDAEAS